MAALQTLCPLSFAAVFQRVDRAVFRADGLAVRAFRSKTQSEPVRHLSPRRAAVLAAPNSNVVEDKRGLLVAVTASRSSGGAPDSPAPAKAEQRLEDVKGQAHALFDGDYYLERYPDVAKAGVDPYWHFVHYGWREGRNPNEFFDPSWYLQRNPDVREAGRDPLKHYTEYGWKEGRDPGPKFSVKNYLSLYGDVREAGSEPLEHYIRYGKSEGRFIGEGCPFGESYGDWIAKYDTLDDKMRTLMLNRIARFALQPKLSIVMPVYNTNLRWLRDAIESVRRADSIRTGSFVSPTMPRHCQV